MAKRNGVHENIHLFVALLGPILGVLLGIPVSPKTLMEILVGGVSEPLNLFPHLAHANCTLFFTSRAAFVCKKKTRSFRVFPPEN